jgi:hypothetical protein
MAEAVRQRDQAQSRELAVALMSQLDVNPERSWRLRGNVETGVQPGSRVTVWRCMPGVNRGGELWMGVCSGSGIGVSEEIKGYARDARFQYDGRAKDHEDTRYEPVTTLFHSADEPLVAG